MPYILKVRFRWHQIGEVAQQDSTRLIRISIPPSVPNYRTMKLDAISKGKVLACLTPIWAANTRDGGGLSLAANEVGIFLENGTRLC